MLPKESQSIGGRQLIKAAAFVFVLYEIGLSPKVGFYQYTR
jgi:hypothetical protein